MRSVIHQHAAAADGGIAVPAVRHVHRRSERVFHQYDLADETARSQVARLPNVVDEAEFRRHRNQQSVAERQRRHAIRALDVDRQGLLAQDVRSGLQGGARHRLVRCRRRADHDPVEFLDHQHFNEVGVDVAAGQVAERGNGRGVGIARARENDAVDALDRFGVGARDGAGPDDSKA